ncbi:MAG: class GN sortase [Hyphomicrobiaceae bacterium]
MTPVHPRFGAIGVRPSPRAVAAFAVASLGLLLMGQAVYIHAKAIVAQVLLRQAFAASVATGAPVKPWSWADVWPVARIAVPRLGASAIVLSGTSGQALAFGPGHLEGSAMRGQPGTTVFAAHRDTHFAFLRNVKIGDDIIATGPDGAPHTYRVTHTEVVAWDRAMIDFAAPGRHLVLATCWPFDATFHGPLRYLVHASVVPDEE